MDLAPGPRREPPVPPSSSARSSGTVRFDWETPAFHACFRSFADLGALRIGHQHPGGQRSSRATPSTFRRLESIAVTQGSLSSSDADERIRQQLAGSGQAQPSRASACPSQPATPGANPRAAIGPRFSEPPVRWLWKPSGLACRNRRRGSPPPSSARNLSLQRIRINSISSVSAASGPNWR